MLRGITSLSETYFHLHLGTGSLGLGLVTYLSQKAGLKPILANRFSSGSQRKNLAIAHRKEYTVHIGGVQERVPVADIFRLEDKPGLTRTIKDPKTILLTTALREEGVRQCVPLISELIAARIRMRPAAPLFVIACENRPDSLWLYARVQEQLGAVSSADELRQFVIFLPCIVDRICTDTGYDEDRIRAFVYVEPFVSWVIERGPRSHILETIFAPLVAAGAIEFVDDIEPYKLRKLWLVNGPHLLLALLAKGAGQPATDIFLRSRLNRELFRRIQRELTEAVLLATNTFSAQKLTVLNERCCARFEGFPDTVARIAGRFRRDKLEAFWADLEAKVAEPVRLLALRKPHAEIRWTSFAVFEAVRMIASQDYVE